MSNVATRIVCSLSIMLSGAAEEKPLDYTVHSGYFEKNDSSLEGRESFLAITRQAKFDRLFGAARTMGRPPKALPAGAFDSRMVVAVIKRGGEAWTYEVQALTAEGETLTVRYKATSSDGGGARFASPLIVSLPKGPYRSVTFIEDGKEAGRARIPAPED